MTAKAKVHSVSQDEPLRDVPEGWAEVTLPEISDINPSKPPRDALPARALVTFVPMPAVDAELGAITRPESRPFAQVRKGFTAFRDDDVIMAKITPCMENGKAAVARSLQNGVGFGSTEFHVLRPNGAVLPDFLYHFIRRESYRKEAESEMTGSVGQKRVPSDFLKKTSIALPPLPEQARIIAKVDELLLQSRSAQAHLSKAPKILKAFRQSVLAAACSGRLTEDWREEHQQIGTAGQLMARVLQEREKRQKQARTGRRAQADRQTLPNIRTDLNLIDLPDSWGWADMRFLMAPDEDFCYGVVQPGKNDPDGAYLVRAGDLRDGTVDLTALRRIPLGVHQEYRRSHLRGGELLVTVVGAGIGESAIVQKECAGFNVARAVAKIPIREFSAEFVHYWLSSTTAIAWMKADAREVARPTLNLEQLETLPVPVPPTEEQHEIVHRVAALFKLADKIERRIEAATKRANKLTQAILAQAFRGELVQTEAELARIDGRAYEPASVLVERITAERNGLAAAKNGASQKRPLLKRTK